MDEFKKRFKSFAWRVGMIVIVVLLDAVLANIGILELPTWAVGLIGLALGEVSKFLHNVKVGKVVGFR